MTFDYEAYNKLFHSEQNSVSNSGNVQSEKKDAQVDDSAVDESAADQADESEDQEDNQPDQDESLDGGE